MDQIVDMLNKLDNWVWGWWMIALLFGTHLFMTIRTGFIQRQTVAKGIKLSVTKDTDGEGIVKPFGEMEEEDILKCLKATDWCPADLGYFRGGGYSSRFLTASRMPVTMSRINLVKGLGPVMQIAEGYTVVLPDEVSEVLWKRTDYTWPCTWFAPRITGTGAFKSAYDVMNNWGANHGAISFGHIGADLITLCSMLRIPVCMHNVEEERIFRPACWNAFGMDKESQDYQACKNYGPMYR